jgi:hypothetical protein
MPVHAGLEAEGRGLERAHFARWLALFEGAARESCPAPAVPFLMEKARRIAESLALGVEVARGDLPVAKRTGQAPPSALLRRVVRLVHATPVAADDAEAGLEALAAALGAALSPALLADVVREGVRRGWLREPVRLPPGALQCHWVLEATPAGHRMAGKEASDA